MRPRLLLATALLTVAAGLGGCGGPSAGPVASPAQVAHAAAATAAARPCGWRTTTTYRHVLWIWMENRSYRQVLGSPGTSPRLTAYARACGVAISYRAITHPSLPNYLAATQGTTGGVSSDCDPASCPQAGPSLFGQLGAAGRTWRGYAQAMSRRCDTTSYGRYAARHNPAVYYLAIRSQCRVDDVPLGGSAGPLATALRARALPSFAFVTPDLCNDGHDCSTSRADSWLGGELDRITGSPAYRHGDTVVFVTWDEGEGGDQRIATVVLGPTVPPGTRDPTPYTHYSLLRTTEQLLGVTPLAAARSAASMRRGFHL